MHHIKQHFFSQEMIYLELSNVESNWYLDDKKKIDNLILIHNLVVMILEIIIEKLVLFKF